MKILSITAGAAGMYCGSCFRDNTLAAEMGREGHQVTLVPLYTPTRTDEPNVSEGRVFFGGVSVYLEQHIGLFRHSAPFLDRLWDAPWFLRAISGLSISTNPRALGGLTVSMLRGEEGFQAKEFQKLLRWVESQEKPDVVNLPNSLLIGLAGPLRAALGCPVLCTLQGEDIFLEGLPEPFRGQARELIRERIGTVDGFIAVSKYYGDFMSNYLGIPYDKVHVVPLGIHLDGLEPQHERPHRLFTVGYFARLAPEKGLHNLCQAYRRLRHSGALPEARLEAAGYLAPEHRGYLRDIAAQMRDWRLEEEFHYRGALDRQGKIEFLRGLDVLSVPSSYREPKGLYVLEAMACGVPVVQPRHGAFPEILGKTEGGILVESEQPRHIAEGILAVARNRARARELGQKGRKGVEAHFTAAHMARRALEVYTAVRAGLVQAPEPATTQ